MVKGICFQFQNTGQCYKGATCTYKHIGKEKNNSYDNMASPHDGSYRKGLYSSTRSINKSTGTSVARSGSPPPGFCFSWWKNGACSKGFGCTYKHEFQLPVSLSDSHSPGEFETNLISPAPQSTSSGTCKRSRDKADSDILSAEFHICKTSDPDKCNEKKEISSQNKLNPPAVRVAPIFCQPVKKEKKLISGGKTFPEEYRNLFRRKKGVNLFIKNGLVVWEFTYNANVIRAIKEHIKGRAWNPHLGRKGCWTCPLESLPDAIALYEHMGRSASSELKQRAKGIQDKFGDSSASDAIKIRVDIYLDKLKDGKNIEIGLEKEDGDEDNDDVFGSITVTFLYDSDIVQSLKMLAPTQRTFDPVSKAWKLDLLALPLMLENLSLPLGYNLQCPQAPSKFGIAYK